MPLRPPPSAQVLLRGRSCAAFTPARFVLSSLQHSTSSVARQRSVIYSSLSISSHLRHLSTSRASYRPAPSKPSPQPPNPQSTPPSPSPSPSPSAPQSPPNSPLPPTAPLLEDIKTLPNLLTLSRLLSAPLISYLILLPSPSLALATFLLASLTDLLDGYLARQHNSKTVLGSILDPVADKTLMLAVTGSLVVSGAVPVWFAAVTVGRDALLGVAALYWRWVSLPPPRTVGRFWDVRLPSAEVRPSLVGKLNTLGQVLVLGVCVARPVLEGWGVSGLGEVLGWGMGVVGITTVWSGVGYLLGSGGVRVLKRKGR